MAKLYVTEYSSIGGPSGQIAQIAATPCVVDQTPVVIGGGSLQSAAFNAKTRIIRVTTDAICSLVVGGTNPVATVNNARMSADTTEYYFVQPSDKLAVIANT